MHAPPPPGWTEFTIMMECTPESGLCQSICTPSSVGEIGGFVLPFQLENTLKLWWQGQQNILHITVAVSKQDWDIYSFLGVVYAVLNNVFEAVHLFLIRARS